MSVFDDADLNVPAARSRTPWVILSLLVGTAVVAGVLYLIATRANAAQNGAQEQAQTEPLDLDMSEFTETPEGVKYKTVDQPAEPKVAQDGDVLLVHYRGSLESGRVFDTSLEPRAGARKAYGEPLVLRLGDGEVIKGWEIGLRGMSVGEQRRLVIPPELAYGDKGAGDVIPPGATLIFDVELVGLYRAPEAGEAGDTPAE